MTPTPSELAATAYDKQGRRVSPRDAERSCERGALCANARQASEEQLGYEARQRAAQRLGPAFNGRALERPGKRLRYAAAAATARAWGRVRPAPIQVCAISGV
jgi:hypothetical protein